MSGMIYFLKLEVH